MKNKVVTGFCLGAILGILGLAPRLVWPGGAGRFGRNYVGSPFKGSIT
jgi:hypothetical protein